MDVICDTDHSVGTGNDEQLHDGRVYPHPVDHRHYHCFGSSHSGSKAFLNIKNIIFSFLADPALLMLLRAVEESFPVPMTGSIGDSCPLRKQFLWER